MANFYGATSLTGGGTGALDAIDGTDLADGDGAVVITSSGFNIYCLDADSAASESSPYIISPDSNPGDKRWILKNESTGFTSRFEAYRTSSQSINSGSFIKVQLNNEGYDSKNEFDNATNYRFTASESGYYLFEGLVKLENLGDNKIAQIGLYIDGTTYYAAAKVHINGATSAHRSLYVNRALYLAANSYVELYIYHNHGSALNIEGQRYMCYLTGNRIS